ncbi:MAG: hypothetical protein IKR59_10660, partial [Lachnospiraceae bacterium]|nr:hypothetical protein [Lachnospiraceae bacterium]
MRKAFRYAAAAVLSLAVGVLAATAFASDSGEKGGRLNLEKGTITTNVTLYGESLSGMKPE